MSLVKKPNRARVTIREPIAHARESPPRRRDGNVEVGTARFRRIAVRILLVLAAAWAITSPAPRSLPAEEPDTGTDGDGVLVGWPTLAGLNERTGEAEPELAALNGKLVKVPGYIVPLEDDASEFLLVPYVGACIHVPPPPPNQMIYVRIPPDTEAEVDPWGWDPIYVVGKLEIARYDSPYGDAGFRMTALRTEPYVWSQR